MTLKISNFLIIIFFFDLNDVLECKKNSGHVFFVTINDVCIKIK